MKTDMEGDGESKVTRAFALGIAIALAAVPAIAGHRLPSPGTTTACLGDGVGHEPDPGRGADEGDRGTEPASDRYLVAAIAMTTESDQGNSNLRRVTGVIL
jgi:hypothetical protein